MKKSIFFIFALLSLFLLSCKVNVDDSNVTQQNTNTQTPPQVPENTSSYKYIIPSFDVYDMESGEKREFNTFDRLYLTVTKNDGTFSNYILGLGSNDWYEYNSDGRTKAIIDYNNAKRVEAIYAPLYEYNDEEKLVFDINSHDVPGNYYASKAEVLKSNGIIDKKTKTVTFNFEREYSQLKIKVKPFQRLRINITNFSSADSSINKDISGENYSQTILVYDNPYVYLYGSWDENSEIQIINQKYGKLNEVYKGSIPHFIENGSIELIAMWTDEEPEITQSTVHVKNIDEQYFNFGAFFPGTINQGWWNLCWAASISQSISWWIENSKINHLNYTPTKPNSGFEIEEYKERSGFIFDNIFKVEFQNHGYNPLFGLLWYLDGFRNYSIKASLNYPENENGGYFAGIDNVTDMVWDFSENYNHPNYQNDKIMAEKRYRDISNEIYGCLSNGQPIIFVDAYYNTGLKKDEEHAFVIWGASFDENGLVNEVRVSDSNGGYILPEHDTRKLGIVKVNLRQDNKIYLNYYDPTNPYEVYGDTHSLEYMYSLYPDFNDISYIVK